MKDLRYNPPPLENPGSPIADIFPSKSRSSFTDMSGELIVRKLKLLLYKYQILPLTNKQCKVVVHWSKKRTATCMATINCLNKNAFQ